MCSVTAWETVTLFIKRNRSSRESSVALSCLHFRQLCHHAAWQIRWIYIVAGCKPASLNALVCTLLCFSIAFMHTSVIVSSLWFAESKRPFSVIVLINWHRCRFKHTDTCPHAQSHNPATHTCDCVLLILALSFRCFPKPFPKPPSPLTPDTLPLPAHPHG